MSAKGFFGGLIAVLGILIMLVSGTCSVVVVAMGSFNPGLLIMAAIVGGIPFLLGLTMFQVGRSTDESPSDDSKEIDHPECD